MNNWDRFMFLSLGAIFLLSCVAAIAVTAKVINNVSNRVAVRPEISDEVKDWVEMVQMDYLKVADLVGMML